LRTGFHIDEIYLRHHTPEGHPERVARIEQLLELAARSDRFGVSVIPATRRATHDELALVHDPFYVNILAGAAGRSLMLDPDTFMSPDSFDVACHAAGGVLDLVDRVMGGELDNGFAAVRPPGHHAESDHAMGFCLFNNIAVAAAYALEHHGLQRVLVLDWDVHHCNGTQQMFWDESRVLLVSLHQFPFYPGTGAVDETGGRGAPGHTVNIPMSGGWGDGEYAAAFRRVVRPVAEAFAPELVLVSAGYDAHADDPIGGMRVSDAGFEAMAREVVHIAATYAGGRCVAVLEGGYHLGALERCVELTLKRMQSPEQPQAVHNDGETGKFAPTLAAIRAAHAGRWKL
jgi:acetoin utilization deacetylase AcuC-like enzyme